MNIQSIIKLIEKYDDTNTECDGLTRIIHTVLSNNRVAHKVFFGSVSLGKKLFFPHYWIKLPNNLVIDYRARMWLGPKAQHGVFKPKENVYDGDQIDMPVLDDFLFDILASIG